MAIVGGEGYVKVHILNAPQLKNVPTIQLGANKHKLHKDCGGSTPTTIDI